MRKLLIAEYSEDYRTELINALSGDYQVRDCADGYDALELLHSFRPDILVFDFLLPGLDGLSLLRQTNIPLPTMKLAITSQSSPYTLQCACDLGVDCVLLKPCNPQAVARHIHQLENILQQPPAVDDPRNISAAHLRILNIPDHRDGFHQLCVGIPLFAQDTAQSMGKELYPAIADLCGKSDVRQVEKSIRNVIHDTWKIRDKAVWLHYFPNFTGNQCPANKQFFTGLAKVVNSEYPLSG